MSLVVESLSFSFPDRPRLLDSISFKVDRGESLAILGPSGSGKSTLLGLLGGLLRPVKGWVGVSGATQGRPSLVAWIRQENALLPHRTLADNVALPLLATGWTRAAALARAAEELEAVGLGGLGSARAKFVSGGEAQRAAVARGAVAAPDLLLVDEPTANLDRDNADLVARNLTGRFGQSVVVLATHDPLVAAHCTRAFGLIDGQLTEAPF